VGLATEENLDTFSAEASTLIENQGDKTDREVAEEIFNQADAQLTAPTLEFEISSDIGGRGTFRAYEWKLLLHELLCGVCLTNVQPSAN